MPNTGFLGERVRISELTILEGGNDTPVLSCNVQFTSDEGVVHGIAKHRFPLDAELNNDGGLSLAAKELLAIVVKRVEAMHFRQPHESGAAVLRGISETLRSQGTTSSDEPGTQG
jgi:hypothetical protein